MELADSAQTKGFWVLPHLIITPKLTFLILCLCLDHFFYLYYSSPHFLLLKPKKTLLNLVQMLLPPGQRQPGARHVQSHSAQKSRQSEPQGAQKLAVQEHKTQRGQKTGLRSHSKFMGLLGGEQLLHEATGGQQPSPDHESWPEVWEKN